MLPNILTFGRILITFLLIPLFLTDSLPLHIFALVLLVFAFYTDYADGVLARKFNVITKTGKLLDPLADKILVLTLFSILAVVGILPWYVVVLVGFREAVITFLRYHFYFKGTIVASERSGKIKSTFQYICSIFGILLLIYTSHFVAAVPLWVNTILLILFNLTVLIMLFLTYYSGIQFFIKNKKLF